METVLEILAKVKPNVDFKNATAIVDDGLLRLVALFSFQIRIGAVLLKSTVCLAAIFCLDISGVVWYSLASMALARVVYPCSTGL